MKRVRVQRGLSIVELMVGLVVGLLVVAAALAVMLQQLREQRALWAESQLTQDLRAVSEIMLRDMRRAGYWGDAASALQAASVPSSNPYAALSPAAGASDAVDFRFSRDAVENEIADGNEQFGFRLRRGVIEMHLGDAGWQAMTDRTTMNVTAFSIEPLVQPIALNAVCARACSSGSTACPPTQQVRSLALRITAESATEPRVVRSVQSQVRLRNDVIEGTCPP